MVTRTSLRHFALPPRARVETAARRAHQRLSARNRRALERPTAQALAELSRMVLGPAAPALATRRLLVVTDGALQYVPFAALPLPAPGAAAIEVGGPPLVSAHEVVHLPIERNRGQHQPGESADEEIENEAADPPHRQQKMQQAGRRRHAGRRRQWRRD